MEAHYNEHDSTYISIKGYGVNEPITIVEYDNITHEKLS